MAAATTFPVRQPGTTMLQPDHYDVESLASILSNFTSTCRNTDCGKSVAVLDIAQHVESWLTGAQRIPPTSQISGLSCAQCFTTTCAGCGQEPKLGQENTFTSLGVVNSCCVNGRLYGIWLLLSQFDSREIASKKIQVSNRTPSKVKKSHPAGSGYNDASSNGVGYAGGWDPYYSPSNNSLPTSSFVDVEEEGPDELTIRVLKLVTALIPTAATVEDYTMVTELTLLLPSSYLFDYLAELVRNDSITDLVTRRNLYTAAFGLLEAMSQHRLLQHLLFLRRRVKKNSPGLKSLYSDRGQLEFVKALSSKDTLNSIYDNGEHLVKQARALLKLSQRTPSSSDHSKESTRMCKIVVTLFDTLQRLKDAESALKCLHIKASDPESSQTWAMYCSENAITFSDDVLRNHRHEDKFGSTKTSNKGRLTAIGREIANMTTSLPTGVFVRVAESRSDVMKILIVGIEGTPYEGGLFTFDLFLDSNYPNSPPKITFTLEGNDSEDWSFNPNLHKGTGTVCLSIINTWQGSSAEMWQPGKSTILAVLISIQAMILGAELPWINEPGFAQQHQTPEAQDHKILIQYKTVRYAILRWLGPVIDAKKSVWDEVRKVYWQHHALSTFMTVKKWAKSNHMISEVPGFKTKSTKKGNRQVNTPALPDGDLLEKLATVLNFTEHLDPKPPKIEEPETSTKPTTRSRSNKKKKGKGKRKQEEISEDSETDYSLDNYLDGEDEEAALPVSDSQPPLKKKKTSADPPPPPKSEPSPKKGKGKGKAKAKVEIETRWVYTGGKTQKESRQACADFEISGAKSIKDTIMKLEAYVNDNGLAEDDAAQRWGTLEAMA